MNTHSSEKKYTEGLLCMGKLVFDFAKVYRVVYHDDGETPESDTDHTVMVALIACSLAEQFYKDELDSGLVAQIAIAHDFVEVYAGDVNTFGINNSLIQEKEHREMRALHLIEDMFQDVYPWLPKMIGLYERKETKEARFVKTVDKMMTQITHILNNGVYFKKKRMKEDEARNHYENLLYRVESTYGKEFPLLVTFMKDLTNEALKKTYD